MTTIRRFGGGGHVDVVQPDAQPGDDAALGRGRRSPAAGTLAQLVMMRVGIGGQGGERWRRLCSGGNDQLGVDLGQRLALDIQIGPGIIGQKDFEFRHGGQSTLSELVTRSSV